MPDRLSKRQRSRLMSLVRGRNTRFELLFLRSLSAEIYPMGFRYRKHCRSIFGTPDIAFPKYKIAIFLDSDFWHGRNYNELVGRMNAFWRGKIERNMERDREVNLKLRGDGWTVLRFGEREVKKAPTMVVRRISAALVRLSEKRANKVKRTRVR